jgi:hypothetical protein
VCKVGIIQRSVERKGKEQLLLGNLYDVVKENPTDRDQRVKKVEKGARSLNASASAAAGRLCIVGLVMFVMLL